MKSHQRPPAVVLVPDQESTPTALGIIRSLGRAAVPVIAAVSRRGGPSFFSRYVKHRLVCPSLEDEPDRWKDALIEWGMSLAEKPVLFPSGDEHVVAVHRYRAELSRCFHYSFLDPQALLNCIDKRQMYQACKRAEIEVGEVCFDVDPAHRDDVVRQAVFPSVLKPAMWINLQDERPRRYREFIGAFGQKAVSVRTPDELRSALARPTHSPMPLLLQEEVPGPSSAIYIVAVYVDQGAAIRGLFVGRKARQYPSQFGDGTMIENVHCHELETLTRSVVEALGFHGIADVEFKRHPVTGCFHLMEINPRAGAWITMAPASGVNIPYLAYLDAIGAELPRMIQTDRPVRWIDGGQDVRYWLSYRSGDHTGRPLPLIEYLRSLRGQREGAYWALDDPLPGVAKATGLPGGVWRVLKRGMLVRRQGADGNRHWRSQL